MLPLFPSKGFEVVIIGQSNRKAFFVARFIQRIHFLPLSVRLFTTTALHLIVLFLYPQKCLKYEQRALIARLLRSVLISLHFHHCTSACFVVGYGCLLYFLSSFQDMTEKRPLIEATTNRTSWLAIHLHSSRGRKIEPLVLSSKRSVGSR